jgi:hypothetical protein
VAVTIETRLQRSKHHVLTRIADTPIGRAPFWHLFIDRVLPAELYEGLRARMLHHKHGTEVQDRLQDNAAFVNRRYSLVQCADPEVVELRAVFADPEVKTALLRSFYAHATRELEQALKIHEEFEFVYTAAGRFQNIHLDIPPKFLSFVFYLPERAVTPAEEERNATVLYDKTLTPCYAAKFRANSVCVFAPHFYTYHGFASTIDRDVLVMFYVSEREQANWARARELDTPPFVSLRDAIESKLQAHPLLEYGSDRTRIAEERAQCLVNAPKGRVMRGEARAPGMLETTM